MAADAECVIVGGGIGGAVLALTLGQAGRRVLILERDAALEPDFRKSSILVVSEEKIGDGVIGHIDIGIAVVVEIEADQDGSALVGGPAGGYGGGVEQRGVRTGA